MSGYPFGVIIEIVDIAAFISRNANHLWGIGMGKSMDAGEAGLGP